MAGKTAGQEILENAYKLSTPADNIAYYRKFAPFYDADFVEHMGYHYPKVIAEAYHRLAKEADIPIADVGCGTGLVATELAISQTNIDGMDISQEMLNVAKERKLYRELYEVDLTGPLDMIVRNYGAVLSAGTFTHGHLGPGPLRGLLKIARAGFLFVIGINQTHFEQERFSETLNSMMSDGKITQVQVDEVNIYSKPSHDHSNDHAMILQYRKT